MFSILNTITSTLDSYILLEHINILKLLYQYIIHSYRILILKYIRMEIKITATRQRRQHKSTSIPFRFVFRESFVRHILFRDLYRNKITLVYLPPNVHLRKYLSGGLFMVFFRQKDSHRWGIEKICSNRDRNIFDYSSPTNRCTGRKKIYCTRP